MSSFSNLRRLNVVAVFYQNLTMAGGFNFSTSDFFFFCRVGALALAALRRKRRWSVVSLSVAESPMRGSSAKASSSQFANRFFGLGGRGGRDGVVVVGVFFFLVVGVVVVEERRGVFLGRWTS